MAKVKIPKEVKIGNRVIKVEFTKEADEMGVYGFYNPQEFRIGLSAAKENQNPTTVLESFFHELMHAVADHLRLGFEIEQEMNDKDSAAEDAFKIEERIAEGFARTLIQVFRENKLDSLMG